MERKQKMRPQSKIFSALSSFSSRMRRAFSESFSLRVLTGKINPKDKTVPISTALAERSKFKSKISIPSKRFTAKSIENSFIYSKVTALMQRLRDLYLKSIGAAVFSFGVYTSIVSLVRHLSVTATAPIISSGVFEGALLTVMGAVLSTSSKTVSNAVTESKIMSFLLFKVLGVKREKMMPSGRPFGRSDVSILVGLALGLLSELTGPAGIAVSILLGLIGYTILCQPESGVIMIILAFPFADSRRLILVCGFVLLAWLLKLIRGKRILTVGFSDALYLLFSAVILLGGLISISPESGKELSVKLVLLMSVYLTVPSLISTKQWLDRCFRCIIFSLSSLIILNLLSVALVHYGFPPIEIISTELPKSSISAVITVLLPLLLSYAVTTDTADKKTGLALLSLLAVVCLFVCGTKTGVLTAMATVLVFFFIVDRRAFSVLIVLLIFASSVTLAMPETVGALLSNFFEISENSLSFRQMMGRASSELLGISPIGGVGIGDKAMLYATPTYIKGSVISQMSTVQRLVGGLGLTGLLIFSVFSLSFIRRCSRHLFAALTVSPRHKAAEASCLCGAVGGLTLGFFSNTVSSPQSYMVLWLVFGLAVSAIKIGDTQKTEQQLSGPYIEINLNSMEVTEEYNGTK